MKTMSKITAMLTGVALLVSLGLLHFWRSVVMRLVEGSGGDLSTLPRPTVFAFHITGPAVSMILLVAGIGSIIISERAVKRSEMRLLVHILVLFFTIAALCVAMLGFFLPFYIPDVAIP